MIEREYSQFVSLLKDSDYLKNSYKSLIKKTKNCKRKKKNTQTTEMNKSQRCETQEHRKRCSASFINKEMQTKLMRSYFILIRMAEK